MQGWEWGTALGLRYGDGQGFRTMRQQRIHSTQPMRLQLQPPAQRVLIMCSYDRGFSLTRSHLEGKLQERGGKWGSESILAPLLLEVLQSALSAAAVASHLHPCVWTHSSQHPQVQSSAGGPPPHGRRNVDPFGAGPQWGHWHGGPTPSQTQQSSEKLD